MASVWLLLVLWIFVNALIKVIQASSCATIHTPATVVRSGSPVSVSCSIKDDCTLTKGKDFHVAWKINNRFEPSNLSYQETNGTYGVIIPSLDTETFIACAVCEEENCQIVNGVQVKVGYPPPIPKNLSCSLNLRPENRFLLLEINVTAVNVFGNVTSETLKLIPMETAIFDPPEINRIEADVAGCLNYSWSLGKSEQWLTTAISLELRLKTVDNQQNKELVLPFTKKNGGKINVCGLFHGTNYSTTMRVKYSTLSKWSEWSEWSDPKIANTVMKAPTGSLDTWLKVDDQNAQLYWKPSENFRPNGWNLSYIVESMEPKRNLCITQESHCFFNLTEKVEKIYLRATNAAASSDHTEVPVYRKKGLGSVSNFSVHPRSEMSVLLVWGDTPASLTVTGYVLEWRSLNEMPEAPLSFTLMDKNISSTILTGLRPDKHYEISIYPKYDKGIGIPYSLAYSFQKASSVAPVLNTMREHSNERNGTIRDGIEMTMFVIPVYIGLSLLIIIVFACFGKNERVKMCLWPIIPDPANSSIKKWTTTYSMEGIPSFVEDKDSVLVYLSRFSLLDLDEKEPFKSDYVKESQWSRDINSYDECHSSLQTCVQYDSEHDRDSVPYATVVFSGPYQNHSSCRPPYVRSESTQPLLGADDPCSPPPYENVSPSGSVSKVQRFSTFPQNFTESEENEELWEEFPMLRSLELRGTDHT